MKLLGHESMATSQRYVAGAGTENRDAAARNPLYQFTEEQSSAVWIAESARFSCRLHRPRVSALAFGLAPAVSSLPIPCDGQR
jgi:hypothetical protein